TGVEKLRLFPYPNGPFHTTCNITPMLLIRNLCITTMLLRLRLCSAVYISRDIEGHKGALSPVGQGQKHTPIGDEIPYVLWMIAASPRPRQLNLKLEFSS
uniref:Uncharacterized protein n=2 Tax=Aegilops tauschii subsp. strangulata TaxID=200361 RepID=A0A453EAE7_AEGTS